VKTSEPAEPHPGSSEWLDRLTRRERRLLRAMVDFNRENGRPPRFRELCALFGYSSPNALSYPIRKLERLGYLLPERTTGGRVGVRVIRLAGVVWHMEYLDTPEGDRLRAALEDA
jgi:SOS-response transcriptional repressor LexA